MKFSDDIFRFIYSLVQDIFIMKA